VFLNRGSRADSETRNSLPVSAYNDHYNYRSYFLDLMQFSEETKKTQLAPQGWSSDHAGLYDSDTNGGWMARRSRFLEFSRDTSGATLEPSFRHDAVTFVGRLRTGFENCKQGLLPNSSLIIHLDFANPDFAVWSPKEITTDYMLKIEKVTLYVQVAQLNLQINNTLQEELTKKSAQYYFREWRCQTHPVAKDRSNFESPELRAPTQASIRIYVAFVKRTAYDGHQHKNP
jgi:hypothetical protein